MMLAQKADTTRWHASAFSSEYPGAPVHPPQLKNVPKYCAAPRSRLFEAVMEPGVGTLVIVRRCSWPVAFRAGRHKTVSWPSHRVACGEHWAMDLARLIITHTRHSPKVTTVAAASVSFLRFWAACSESATPPWLPLMSSAKFIVFTCTGNNSGVPSITKWSLVPMVASDWTGGSG